MSLRLSEIFVYPIKSLGGIYVNQSVVEPRGLKYDRRMMLVNENGEFLTQRTYPRMALLKTSLGENSVDVKNSLTGESISIDLNQVSKDSIDVIIWNDICAALKVSALADDFFSEFLGMHCYLVFMPETEKRIVDKERKFVDDEHIVSFADGYPFLIIGQSSLDDLNSRLEMPVTMDRFRPNFVFSGGTSYEEDNWKEFEINGVLFSAVKPCARCVITTTDQNTGVRQKEPLKTLSSYRTINNKVMFGMNIVSKNQGIVFVGSKINLL